MKKINLKYLLIAISIIIAFSLVAGEAFARSKGFSGFKSSRSFSKKSYSKSTFNWGKKSSGLSGSKRKGSARRMSSADRGLYNKAKASGTAFSNKSDAVKSFKSNHASKYPTKFTSQPSVRPGYIPSNITTKGNRHKVVYRNGGYGYYMGAMWLFYDPFDDDDETDELMAENGYYYGPKPGLSFMAILGIGITIFLLLNLLKTFAVQGKRQPFKTYK